MYYLTLTKKDRDAIDWIGGRYSHGDALRRVLTGCHTGTLFDNGMGLRFFPSTDENEEWDYHTDLTFQVPEKTAWRIRDLVTEDGMACFSPKLVAKFNDFVSKIV